MISSIQALSLRGLSPLTSTIAIALLGFAITGCDSAFMACTSAARDANDALSVVAAFPSTVGAIRRSPVNAAHRLLWPQRSDGDAAVLCYFDGFVPKAAPGREPYDRVALAVADGEVEFIAAGYQYSPPDNGAVGHRRSARSSAPYLLPLRSGRRSALGRGLAVRSAVSRRMSGRVQADGLKDPETNEYLHRAPDPSVSVRVTRRPC
jgi:hypothetical protein